MISDRKEMRRKSMQGTVLLVLGLIAGVACAATGGLLWLGIAAVILVAVGIVLLHQVGKSLP
jgi:hypothetical protein